MQTKNKLNIDIFLFLFLSLLVFALLEHTARCANFLISRDSPNELLCFLIALSFFFGLLFCLFKSQKLKIYKQYFDILDLLCLGIPLFYYAMKLPFPDTGADTMAYEVFWSKFALTDKAMDMKPYLPYTMGFFSFSERVFYYFRIIFGYRLSTLINFLVVIISFYKAKEILLFLFKSINPGKFASLNKQFTRLIICCGAFAAIYKEYILIGTLLIKGDLFVLPLFLEFILVVLKRTKTGTLAYAYMGLLAGLSIALKLTNAAYFLPVTIYFIQKNHKNINPKNLLAASLFFVIPILPFVAYNLAATGNPIYPFYNAYFKSPYYRLVNFKDNRWGPKTFFQTIFWGIHLSLSPGKYSELGLYSHSLTIAYPLTFFIFLLEKRIPALKRLLPITVCLIATMLSWSITTGYARYIIGAEVLTFIILTAFIYTLCCNWDKGIYLAFFCYSSALLSLGICTNNLTLKNIEWRWKPSIFTDTSSYINFAKTNLPFILNDRKPTDDPAIKEKLDSVKTWICLDGHSAYPTLSNPAADFFYIHGQNADNPEKFTQKYFETHSKEDLFVLTNLIDKGNMDLINTYGFVVVNYERLALSFADANDPAWFLSLMTKDQAEIYNITGLSPEEIK